MQEMFLDRAILEVANKSVVECILLLKVSIGSLWVAKVLDMPFCLLKARVQFGGSNKGNNKAQFGSCVVYIGPDPTALFHFLRDLRILVTYQGTIHGVTNK
jgi:hypothetical protein